MNRHRSHSSGKAGGALLFAIVGVLLVSSITLYSSVIILAGPIPEPAIAPIFVLGVMGFGLFGISLLVMYTDDPQKNSSIWRLAEKTMFSAGFFLLLVAWFFLGFRGNPGFELLYPYSTLLVIVGSLLSLTGFLSWTERRRIHDDRSG